MAESVSVIRFEDVDPEFKRRVMAIPGADKLTYCFQCGTCTAACPIGRRVEEFRPRSIARMAILGLKKPLFSGELLWLCAGCYACQERCPQQVRPTDVIAALRSIAVQDGIIHPSLKMKTELIAKHGRLYEITEFEDMMREEMGLPPVPKVKIEDIRSLMKGVGLDKLVGLDLEGGE